MADILYELPTLCTPYSHTHTLSHSPTHTLGIIFMTMNTERLYPVRIFCDFDGTISTEDIGYDLFDQYGEQSPWHDQLVEGSLGIRDYWREVAGTLKEPLTDDLLNAYLRTIPIDPDFVHLLDLVQSENVPFTVLSDGLSIYVNRYLSLHGFDDLDVVCNEAWNDEAGNLTIRFPYSADGCKCPSAVCKRNVVLTRSAPEERIIYIGDGLSDFCPAETADIIFAKGNLAAYCNRNGLPHHSWKHLHEVVRELKKLLARRRIRPRHQAEMVRKRVWESG